MEFPTRLGYGKGFIGRDYPGCCNAGAPTMLKSRNAQRYLGRPFAVGRIYEVRYNLAENIMLEMTGKTAKCKFYKTYSAAKAEFVRLSADIDKAYDEVMRASKAVNVGSLDDRMQAAIVLSDNGMI